MTSLEPTAPGSFQSPAGAGFASSDASRELASGWQKLTRDGAQVDRLTLPRLYTYDYQTLPGDGTAILVLTAVITGQ